MGEDINDILRKMMEMTHQKKGKMVASISPDLIGRNAEAMSKATGISLEESRIKVEMKKLKAEIKKIEAQKLTSEAEAEQWWIEVRKKYNLPLGNYTHENGVIFEVEPASFGDNHKKDDDND